MRTSRRARDVRDVIDAYVALYEAGEPPSTSSMVEILAEKWGDRFTDARYVAAENAMYDSPEVREIVRRDRERMAERAARRSGIGNDVRAEVWDKTGGACWYCGTQTHPFRDFTIDHVIPVSKGGTDDLDNLVPCCRPCNCRKGNR